MPDLSSLLANECWVDVEVPGGTFKVAYQPGNISLMRQAEIQKTIRQVQADSDEVAQAGTFAELVCEVLLDWDLTDNGEPLPIEPDVIARVIPGAWVVPIINAVISGDSMTQEEKKIPNATSAGGSPPAGKRASARNGTRPSERANTWA